MQQPSFASIPLQKVDAPTCLRCGTSMWLTRVEPDQPGHDRRVFECLQCGKEEDLVVKFK